jgi:hypothetical protein
MAIVDSLSSPASQATYDANADCHIIIVWTNEHDKWIQTYFRYDNFNDTVRVSLRADGTNSLILQYKDGSTNDVAEVTGIFTDEIEYRVDIYANGSNIKVDVDDVEKINETLTYNQASTGGRIDHNLDTNDIELESWPYGEPSESINLVPADLDHKTTFPGGGAGLWEIGAYIYEGGIENPLVPQVIRQLVAGDLDHVSAFEEPTVVVASDALDLIIDDLDHVLSLGEPAFTIIRLLIVADLDHAMALGEPAVVLFELEPAVISLTIDTNGKPIIYEGAVARIEGSNSDVTDDDDWAVILDGTSVSLFVNGTQIGSTYTSLAADTGRVFTMTDIGTGGASDSVELFPRDVTDALPSELV